MAVEHGDHPLARADRPENAVRHLAIRIPPLAADRVTIRKPFAAGIQLPQPFRRRGVSGDVALLRTGDVLVESTIHRTSEQYIITSAPLVGIVLKPALTLVLKIQPLLPSER